MSKVVLRQFLNQNHLTLYDRDSDILYDKPGIRGAFKMPFDMHDPEHSEERWQHVENRMTAAYEAIAAGTALGQPEVVETLRDVLAVHWARSPAMRERQSQVTDEVAARHVAQLDTYRGLLGRAFTQRTGLHPGGAADLEWFNKRIHDEVVETNREEWWSQRNVIHYEFARKKFARYALHIGHADDADFIIGDVPVITLKPGHDGVNVHQGVALGDATTILMPISPTVLIGLGPKPAEGTVSVGGVRAFNGMQLSGFIRWLGARPGSTSAKLLREHSNARTVMPPRVY